MIRQLKCFGVGSVCKKRAFTLAEMIIVIAIVGIVATTVLPGLIVDSRRKQFATSKTVFQARLYEGMRQMNVQGDFNGYTKTSDFVNNFGRYFKIIKICEDGNLSECFAGTIKFGNDPLTLKNDGSANFYGTDNWGNGDNKVVGMVLGNGKTALIKYNPSCPIRGVEARGEDLARCIALMYDNNGLKNPNRVGQDINGDLLVGLSPGFNFSDINGIDVAIDAPSTMALVGINTYNDPNSKGFDLDCDKNVISCVSNKWAEAKSICMGGGGRLPTVQELQIIGKDPRFHSDYYWTSDQLDRYYAFTIVPGTGVQSYSSKDDYMNENPMIACVR